MLKEYGFIASKMVLSVFTNNILTASCSPNDEYYKRNEPAAVEMCVFPMICGTFENIWSTETCYYDAFAWK